MTESFDRFNVGLIVFAGLLLAGSAGLSVWLWRGRFLPGGGRGFRLEEHRRQMRRALARIAPIWGVLLLLVADRAVDLCHLPRVGRAFWRGAFCASWLFVTGLMVPGVLASYRQYREALAARRSAEAREAGAGPSGA